MSFTSQGSNPPNQTFGKDASFKLPQLIGAMSISPSGRDVVLGSKEGLHIIDLDTPYSPPRFLPHRSPWEVADVQWSPFAERDYWVVSTSNQKALLWNLNAYGWRNSIERVLHGHTRAITDVNFSAHHPDKLATCAVDSFVHCWDMRTPARPVISFSDWFAGATQVKWSRQAEHVIASSHDKFLHLWDDRMGAYPARTIEAHGTKIYGIDWNRFEPSKIVTCSLDKTIKFWDTSNPEDVPDRVIETTFPVWRARHTPFGWGLMVMPQRGSGDLHLYDRRAHHGVPESGRVKPVHVFPGHNGQIKEFLWRSFGTVKEGIDHRDFQLVTWGTDRELKLHAVPQNIFEDVGYEKGVSKPQRLRFTRRGAKYRTFRDEPVEQESFGIPSRTESFPASSQFLRARGRLSTNMGMSRVPLTQFRGLAHGGKAGRRTDMHGKGTGRPDTDPIAWMRNVKIASWDTDALADEITLIGDKFKKVEFESIDLAHRKATMSLQSSWGDLENNVHTRVELKFPKGYPRDAQVVVHVQKTNLIAPDTQRRMASDIATLAEAYRTRGRGCLESIVRYLLREQNVEQILDLLLRDSLTESKVLDPANALEGSDESDDDQLDNIPAVVQPNANVNIPLAKGCAALWSESGMLVCFFQHKPKQSASFLEALGSGHLDSTDPTKLFGGFGHVQVDSPRNRKIGSELLTDDNASEISDQSSSTSSSISSSETPLEFEEKKSRMPWQRMAMPSLQRTKSDEASQKSTVLDSTQADGSAKKAYVSMHDLGDLLPSSKIAAARYKILGDAITVCQHNSLVAQQNSKLEAARIWRLTLASFQIPSKQDIEEMLRSDPGMSVLVRKIRQDLSERASADPTRTSTSSFTGTVWLDWPDKTLERGPLLPALIQYCELIADVQTLAILAAIYLQSQVAVLDRLCKMPFEARQMAIGTHSPSFRSRQSPLSGSHPWRSPHKDSGQQHLDEMHDPQLSVGAIKQQQQTEMPLPKLPFPEDLSTATSRLSSGAPSVIAHDPSGVISALHSTSVSIAGSPESHRVSQRFDAVPSFPSATASLQALTKSRPPSPPDRLRRQSSAQGKSSKSSKPSPNEAFFAEPKSRLKSSFSMVNTSSYGENSSDDRFEQHNLHPKLRQRHETERATNKNAKKKLRTKLFSAPQYTAALEVTPVSQQLQVYRRCLIYMKQYVTQLEVWQLWTQLADMIGIIARFESLLDKLTHDITTSKGQPEPSSTAQIRRCCPQCTRTLDPIEKNGNAIGWHCTSPTCKASSARPSKKQHCCICENILTGLSISCLQCGHLTCYHCGQEWFASNNLPVSKRDSSVSQKSTRSETGKLQSMSCPTGCGCECSAFNNAILFEQSAIDQESQMETTLTTTPTTPRSEDHRNERNQDIQSVEMALRRGQSIGNPALVADSAVNALLALNAQARNRSSSSTAAEISSNQNGVASNIKGTRTRDNSISVVDELLPWADDKTATLGRGIGGGLSRGLSSKGSDSTIRKMSKKD